MSRWFYTDPLAAAYMAKHFGMRFHYPDAGYENSYVYAHVVKSLFSYSGMEPDILDPEDTDGMYYIHPDSLPLLEPRAGDVCILRSWQGQVDENVIVKLAEGLTGLISGERIIERDGKPFFWPDQEQLSQSADS